jgi:hypothetical protein
LQGREIKGVTEKRSQVVEHEAVAQSTVGSNVPIQPFDGSLPGDIIWEPWPILDETPEMEPPPPDGRWPVAMKPLVLGIASIGFISALFLIGLWLSVREGYYLLTLFILVFISYVGYELLFRFPMASSQGRKKRRDGLQTER